MMKFSLISWTTMFVMAHHWMLPTTVAFSPSSISRRSRLFTSHAITSIPPPYIVALYNSIETNSDEPTVEHSPMEPGTHDELMYALGVNLARQLGDVRPLVENGEELASVAKGLLDTVIGRLSEDGQRNLLASRGQELNLLITERANKLRIRLEENGRQMLNEMSQREGTETLESGVVVDITQMGPDGGARPTRSSTVRVHYHGTLADGTVFDSTLDGEPVTFPLANVIPGWVDGILSMYEGDTAMIGIPPEQAYGIEGTPDGRVPGGSTLFFKVELLEVMSAGIGGEAKLVGADGKKLGSNSGSGLIGPDGRPL